jgi:hypothetical protein
LKAEDQTKLSCVLSMSEDQTELDVHSLAEKMC